VERATLTFLLAQLFALNVEPKVRLVVARPRPCLQEAEGARH